jgi:hypothetical protein
MRNIIMIRFPIKGILAAFALLWLSTGTTPARAGLLANLSVDVTRASNGVYTYDYTLSVDPSSTLGAGELDLSVSPFANLSSISGPAGWDVFYTAGSPGDSAITFSSPDSSTDIAPGSFGLFSMTSLIGPALSSDLARGFDDSNGTVDQISGTILTAAVPEPSALMLGVLALVGLAYPVARGSARLRRSN